jgi:hypothetical protein
MGYTVCSTRYRIRHFFNNFTTNEDIATKFEAAYTYTNTHEQQPYCVGALSQMTERRVRQETDWLARGPLLRVATIRRTKDKHYRHIPLHFSLNERAPFQISLQYLHWY